MTQSNTESIINVDILDYLGKHEGGIITFISIGYEGEYYEATFFYTNELLILTTEENLEVKLGCQIEDWHGYNALMLDIISKVVPYEEIINMVDDFDPDKWGLFLENE